ncbi:D-glycero-beta-D-manno-heptose 1,7-bisphosphate 7-phosphatase, partial [Candidatus Albibeggiatoa sp. nov. BB20]|uniref:D-glycero-beta-D-manno-heptose 1,7-bisphosphate 7-phosphatase n=1 Tax=Candidatus Albibeggiatoa sp. nov. BB20 TaxID=3162723 RepID=UPI0033659C16
VINYDSDEYIKSPDEWHPIVGSLEAIARLNQADYRVIIVTNQSGVARGLFDLNTLHEIHAKMHRLLAEMGANIEAIFFCPHVHEDECNCRKPRPGMFHQIANRLGTSLTNVPAVGDSLRDLQAAIAAGAKPILVLTGKGRRTLQDLTEFGDVPVYDDLASVVDALLSQKED